MRTTLAVVAIGFLLGVIARSAIGAPVPASKPPRHAHPAHHINRPRVVPKHARPATRVIFQVCPVRPDGTPVTKPPGVCFKDWVGR